MIWDIVVQVILLCRRSKSSNHKSERHTMDYWLLLYSLKTSCMIITLKWRPKSTSHIYWIRVAPAKNWWQMPIHYLKSEWVALRKEYARQMSRQYHWNPMTWDVHIEIEIRWFGTECDWDNVHKLSMDAWNWILWIDDKQITTAVVKKMGKDNENPRIVLHIKDECRTIQRLPTKAGGSLFESESPVRDAERLL